MHRAGGLVSVLALAALAAALGCGVASHSARSVSKSLDAASDSSSDDPGDALYMRQIRDYSYGFARSGGDTDAFTRGIGALAQRKGIHDWEGSEETCRAIGEGFRDAGSGQSASRAAIGKMVATDSPCYGWMRAGYHERR
jgi:hypothetical protein